MVGKVVAVLLFFCAVQGISSQLAKSGAGGPVFGPGFGAGFGGGFIACQASIQPLRNEINCVDTKALSTCAPASLELNQQVTQLKANQLLIGQIKRNCILESKWSPTADLKTCCENAVATIGKNVQTASDAAFAAAEAVDPVCVQPIRDAYNTCLVTPA